MRKIAQMICSFMLIAVTAQHTEFNYMLVSEYILVQTNGKEKPKVNSMVYYAVNTANHNYFMEIGQNKSDRTYYGILQDYRDQQNRYFKVNYRKNKKVLTIIPDGHRPMQNRKHIDYTALNIKKTGDYRYRITAETDRNQKESQLEIDIQLKPHEEDLLMITFESLTGMQRAEIVELIRKKLDADGHTSNFFVEEITFHYSRNSKLAKKFKPVEITPAFLLNFENMSRLSTAGFLDHE